MNEPLQRRLAEELFERLSAEQRTVLEPHVELVEACPGAGKTRAVVARFVQQVSAATNGVALLSFTNAAIDEARRRCADIPEAFRAPHFVGTFDTFLHRYIVTPDVAATTGKAPRYFQSWHELPGGQHVLRQGGKSGVGVELTRFTHDVDGTIGLVPEALPGDQRAYFDKLSPQERQSLVERGTNRITGLASAQIYDSDSARARALAALGTDRGSNRLKVLARRFSEIIVDEFQDCSAVEHAILEHLRAAGIKVLVVADPNQAIYGFRQAGAHIYDGFRTNVDDSAVVHLTVNYRSSPVICQLITSLAAAPDGTVTCGGPDRHARSPSTIHLLAGDPRAVLARFHALCTSAEIPASDRIVLAYRASQARKLAAGSGTEPHGEGFTKQMLVQLARLRTAADPSVRKAALSRLESLLLAQFEWSSNEERLPVRQQLELLNRDRIWIRSVIGVLWSASQTWTDRESAKYSIKSILGYHLGGENHSLIGTLAKRVQIDEALWTFWTQCLTASVSGASKMRWSTVHGAKGQEFPAVLIEAPDPQTISDWRQGTLSESRRVFYVGVSRAERLLTIHVPKSRISPLAGWLESEGIPVVAEKV